MFRKKLSIIPRDDDLIREPEVLSMIPIGRGQVRTLIPKGLFPAPVRFTTPKGKVIIAWPRGEIRKWNADLVRQRDQQIAAERSRAQAAEAV
jgi:predicted DNA-binding transcriptional regulator AlpA